MFINLILERPNKIFARSRQETRKHAVGKTLHEFFQAL